jgi:membrane protein YqaA with SNARE-associated domain
MTDPTAYLLLFLSAFTSATLLPGSSEAALLAFLATGRGEVATLVIVATVGNVLGSVVNWFLGRFIARFRDRRWFPVKPRDYDRAAAFYGKYGLWSLLLSWVPVIGDPITVVAGALRIDLARFLLLVTLSKAARYVFVAYGFRQWAGA